LRFQNNSLAQFDGGGLRLGHGRCKDCFWNRAPVAGEKVPCLEFKQLDGRPP
jgi:hypothetical protein